MQSGKSETKEEKVISIFSSKKPTTSQSLESENNDENLFEKTMAKNASAQEKRRLERAKANKAVLRSYRIKK